MLKINKLILFFIISFVLNNFCSGQGSPLINPIQKINLNPNSLKIESEKELLTYLRKEYKLPFFDWKIKTDRTDKLGFRHIKVQQLFKGVRVHGGELILHFNEKAFYKVNGQINRVVGLTNKILLTQEEALKKVKEQYPSEQYFEESNPDFEANKIEKWIYSNKNNRFSYIFKIDIYSIKPLFRYQVFIDAESGKIIKKLDRIHTNYIPASGTTLYHGLRNFTTDSVSENLYQLRSNIGGGIHTRDYNGNSFYYIDFFDVDNDWTSVLNNDQASRDVHWGAEQAYQYFSENHTFQSYDNSNAEIICNVHYGSMENNAFWDGTSLSFGDGDGILYNPFTSIDIIGHEFTHGVIQHTANLEYQDESGALNESFADIFGCAIGFYADSTNANYQIGDLISTTGTPLRSLQDPNSTYDPAYYHGNYWYFGYFDAGGVHTNSNVQNKWFHLLAAGETSINETGVSYHITGIGIDKASKIAFRNLSTYLTQYSDYSDAREGAIQAAKDLFGDCSFEVKQTVNAWHAVGIGGSFQHSPTSILSMSEPFSCQIPYTVDFTNLSTGSTTYSWDFGDGATSTQISPSHTYTTSGIYDIKLISNGSDSCGLSSDTLNLPHIIQINQNETPGVASTCNSSFNSVTVNDKIHHFSFANINHQATSFNDSIGDFTCQFSTDLEEGQWYPVSFINQGAEKHIWIDYNNDGDFQQNEKIYPSNIANLQNQVLINPSNPIYNTPIRMRVLSATNTSSFSACADWQSGQQFEYTTRIIQNSHPPQSNFQTTGSNVIPVGQNISFQDLSTNLPTTWEWIFPGANTINSTLQNPTNINYSNIGSYDVTLISTNSFGSDTLTLIDYIHISNSYNMCTTSETDQLHGILYDSGGPNNDYQNNENCSFLIAPNCAEIHLTIDSSGLDHNFDFLNIYQGYDNTGPLLYSNSQNITSAPVSTIGGPLFIEFTTNNIYTNFGWRVEWTSVAPSNKPTANFIVPDTLPFGLPVTLIDNSSELVQHWDWDFGDGSASNDKNPIKTYYDSGLHTIKLVVDNCFGLDTLTQDIIVENPPSFYVTTDTVRTTLNCGATKNVSYTLYNNGLGNLNLVAQNDAHQIHHPELMLFTVGADLSDELIKMRNLLTDSFPSANIEEFDTVHVQNFINMLDGKDILIIPEIDELADTLISPFQTNGPLIAELIPTIQQFVQNGGHVIICANAKMRLSAFGLLVSYEDNFYSDENLPLVIEDSTHEWFNDISFPIVSNKRIATQNIPTQDYISIASYNNQTVLGYLPYEEGQANYFGYDFESDSVDNEIKSLFINIMEQKFTGSRLLIDTNYIIPEGDSLVIDIEVDGFNLDDGTYIDSFLVTTNDVSAISQYLYVEFTINRDLNMDLSTQLIDFDTVFQGTQHVDSFTVFNNSCDTLVIDSVISSNSLFSVSPQNMVVLPYTFKPINVNFLGPIISSYSDSLTIYNNDSIQHIQLAATVKGSPILHVIPDSISTSISTCGDSVTIPVSLYNSGEGPLKGNILGFTYHNDSLSIPFYDSFEDGDYNNWSSAGTDIIVSSQKGSHGNKSLKLNGITNSISRFIPESNPTYYAVKLQQNYYHTAASILTLGNSNDSQGIFKIWKEKHKLYFNSIYHSYTIINHNDWIDIEIKNIDYINHSFDVYINGSLLFPSLSFYNNLTENIDRIKLVKSTSHPLISCYFDELTIGHQSTIDLISLNNDSISLLPGDTQDFEITILSDELQAGDYSYFLDLDVYLPLQDQVLLPIELILTGKSQISSTTSCVDFDTLFQHENKSSDTIWIFNDGCDTLNLTTIEYNSPFYSSSANTFSIEPFDSLAFFVTINDSLIGENSDHITFYSDNNDTLTICLNSYIIGAPNIIVSSPNSNFTLTNCNLDSIIYPYTIYNNGLNNLEIQNSILPIESVLNNLELHSDSITSQIPMKYLFSGGQTGSYIYDGGNDMYDGGNLINTEFMDSIPYTNSTINETSNAFGPSGKYFTAKYDGLFVLTADIDSVNQFSIAGTLGALGIGNMTSGRINQTHGGKEYTGFFKKVYNSGDPSVNHLIIVEKDPNLTHQLPYTTYFDSDIVNGLKNSKRIYYLLFAGDNSIEFPDSIFANTMNAFLNQANYHNLIINTIEPGDSLLTEYAILPTHLENGTHNFNVPIFSNDPDQNPYLLPLSLTIATPPCIINISDSLLGCGGSVDFEIEHSNSATSILWDFGDGTLSSGSTTSHNYSSGGNYTVTAITCNSLDCDTFAYNLHLPPISGPIAANCSPSSSFNFSAYGITEVQFNSISNSSVGTTQGYQDFSCSNSTVLYTGNSYDLNVISGATNPYMYAKAWLDFNNDGLFTANEIIMDIQNSSSPFNTSFTPAFMGITLNTPLRLRIAVDRNHNIFSNNPCSIVYGEFEDYMVRIEDEIIAPESQFSFAESNICEGIFQFTDLSTNQPTSWFWDFGDGTTSTLQNPNHDYDSYGIFLVSLITSNTIGFDTTSQYINTNIAEANINVGSISGISTPIQFSNSSSGGLTFFWNFNDGNTSNLPSPSNTFHNPAVYIVTLKVENSYGCSDIDSVTIDLTAYVGLNELDEKIFVYPNPAKSFVNIVNESSKIISRIHLVNSLGQVVLTHSPNKNDQKIKLNINAFSQGVYHIQYLFTDRSVSTSKIVIE